MIYFMGMSHVMPVLKACSAGGLEQQIGRIHNDLPPKFVDWDLTPGALPEQLRVANLYIRQIAPHWGATLAVQSAITVVGLVPGFQELLSSIMLDPGEPTLFAFIHGEEHIHLSLLEREDPLDFYWPERPDLVVLPKRQVIPLEIIEKQVKAKCRIPDDCIDSKRYPLFMAREVMRQLIDNLCVTPAVHPGALS